MKNIKKFTKILVSLFVLLAFINTPVIVMASDYNADYNENLTRRDDLIVNAIKNGETDLEKLIKESFSIEELSKPKVENIKTIRVEKIDNTIVTFKNDGTFYIDSIKESPTLGENNFSNSFNLKSATQYKTASNSYEARGIFGNLLWKAYIQAEFGYDGKKAWVNGKPYGYYSRGTLSIWQVSNWNTGWTNYEGRLGARAYARGNFHWGAEYEGNGLIVQDLNLDLRVSCNYKGIIFRNNGI